MFKERQHLAGNTFQGQKIVDYINLVSYTKCDAYRCGEVKAMGGRTILPASQSLKCHMRGLGIHFSIARALSLEEAQDYLQEFKEPPFQESVAVSPTAMSESPVILGRKTSFPLEGEMLLRGQRRVE